MIWKARYHVIEFPRRPLVMGIVNINDDSFCGDGTLDPVKALAQAEAMLREGADIIDIGAESARTNRGPISVEEEIQRLLPFMAAWPDLLARLNEAPWDNQQLWPPMLSINTWRSDVIEAILPHGGDLINDISALPDAMNARLCAEYGASLLIMHSIGQPKVPHTHVGYADVLETMSRFFDEKMALAEIAGLSPEQIILDPGIDFAKQREDNLTLYRYADQLQRWGRPVLLPVSRKTVIGQVLGLPNATERDAGTLACIAAGMSRGAQIFRVHNVPAAAQAVKVLWGLR
ncbi:dihydropteroate synthase [Prosthecobacter fusiformis]|uniref:dihydropteroate synthase n=1 Tax=Prosthecobacter fusiformis TaxID=48464 RepID=A0A4R7SRS1_9BACT|nr:dihydropteroate synthase [Prosthecobacter fusiformis]TDU81166.1 dihydropteroate synthase [Prosthecobacter fusiformis]